jgi:hypothetical protein
VFEVDLETSDSRGMSKLTLRPERGSGACRGRILRTEAGLAARNAPGLRVDTGGVSDGRTFVRSSRLPRSIKAAEGIVGLSRGGREGGVGEPDREEPSLSRDKSDVLKTRAGCDMYGLALTS